MQIKFASWKRGFTMIELLVVIAIIGVLAAAVLAAINPVEQINKGRDTARRSDAAELVNASERFYAVQEEWPWNDDNSGTYTVPVGQEDPDSAFSAESGGDWTWMEVLQDTNEVKANFVQRFIDWADSDADAVVIKLPNSGTTFVCFEPKSSQFQKEASERCKADDGSLPDGKSLVLCGAAYGADPTKAFICVP